MTGVRVPIDSYRDFHSTTPADVLSYQNSSMLDTIFVSKSKKKPVWITITAGSQTTLFSVSRSGKLNSAAAIQWLAKGKDSKKPEVAVEIDGVILPAEKFGRQVGGVSGKVGPHFRINDLTCQWSCKSPPSTVTSTYAFSHNRNELLRKWDCTAGMPDSQPSAVAPTSKLKTFFKTAAPEAPRLLLASYLEGRLHKKQELSIYPEGVPHTALLLISAIFTAVGKDFWKKQQSKATPVELETMLSADLTGGLPAYSPVRDSDTSSIVLRPTIRSTPTSRWSQRSRPPTADDLASLPEYAASH